MGKAGPFLPIFNYLRVTRQTGYPLDDILASLKTTEDPQVILLDIRDALASYRGEPRGGEDCASCIALLPHVAILLTTSITFCVSIASN